MKTSLILGTALALVLATGVSSAAKKSYVAPDLDGAKEKPNPVNSAVTGEARFTYDDVTRKLCGHIKVVPSTFVATASHLHVGDSNTAGPVAISLNGFTGELKVNQTLTADEADALDGDLYVNVHSATNPGGEVRDQLAVDGDTGAADEECEGDVPGADAGTGGDAGNAGTPPDAGTGTGTPDVDAGKAATGDAGRVSTSITPAATGDGGCNTTGSSGMGSGLALATALGLALAMASRKRNKRS